MTDKYTAVSLEEVSIGYEKRPIFENINFSILKNQSLGIIGPNGGGKTTFLKTVLGLLEPISGSVKYKKPLTFGYVPQYESFDRIFPVSVSEFVAMGRYNRVQFGKRLNKDDWDVVNKYIAEVGITHLKERTFRTLSGGESQRALLARAMCGEPDLLVLDEPTSSVDKKGEEEIISLIDKFTRTNGITVLMVTHFEKLIREFADVILTLDKDKSVFSVKEV